MSHGADYDDGNTPVDLAVRRPGSVDAKGLADVAVEVATLAAHIGEVARKLDGLEGAERVLVLTMLSKELGDNGDALHEARHLVDDMNKE